ncbi:MULTISPECIES: hypothetical protein [Burkholderia]|uniref:Uncharacterized protein n=1 Tax=Burkholderia singularis TaxID=1503053 RepID=A0A238H3P8_9BURK|nr:MULTISPECIES: hypothetical protein [Burkholderia]SMF99870.1 hypothetical protein BSIN_3057 [Burkholderia singularis]
MKVMSMEQAQEIRGGGPISSIGLLLTQTGPVLSSLATFAPQLGNYLQNPKTYNNQGK